MTRAAGEVIAIGFGVGRATLEDWLAAHPQIVDALETAGARVVLVEIDDLAAVPDWNAHVTGTLAAAAAQLDPAIELPLFVARVGLGSLIDAGVSAFRSDWQPKPAPRSPRGAFVGYFAIGEGGAIYVAPDGDLRGNAELVLRAALERPRS